MDSSDAEVLSSTRSLLRDATVSMKIRFAVFEGSAKPGYVASFEKTAKTPRAGRFPPTRRGSRCRSRLGLLTALDAVRRPSPPRPSEALDAVDARRLRQSRDRRPCLHDSASSTSVRLLGFEIGRASCRERVYRCVCFVYVLVMRFLVCATKPRRRTAVEDAKSWRHGRRSRD